MANWEHKLYVTEAQQPTRKQALLVQVPYAQFDDTLKSLDAQKIPYRLGNSFSTKSPPEFMYVSVPSSAKSAIDAMNLRCTADEYRDDSYVAPRGANESAEDFDRYEKQFGKFSPELAKKQREKMADRLEAGHLSAEDEAALKRDIARIDAQIAHHAGKQTNEASTKRQFTFTFKGDPTEKPYRVTATSKEEAWTKFKFRLKSTKLPYPKATDAEVAEFANEYEIS